jgi:hypothetical protein
MTNLGLQVTTTAFCGDSQARAGRHQSSRVSRVHEERGQRAASSGGNVFVAVRGQIGD